jgi:hypothetical protein
MVGKVMHSARGSSASETRPNETGSCPTNTQRSMALVTCPDCGREVSDQAPACPNCGRPMKASSRPASTSAGAAAAPKKKTSPLAMGCLVIIVLGILGALLGEGSESGSPSQPPAPTTVDLNGRVRFTGTQFVITNSDTFDWGNCKFEVNPKTFSSGYTFRAGTIAAGSTYSVGALQFANGDGVRFNPFTYKPTSFSIWCDVQGGKGYYFGQW